MATGTILRARSMKGGVQKDRYDRYIKIPITNEEGIAMYNKAEEYRTDEEYRYSLYGENCGMVAQYILEAGGKNFVMSDWSADNEKEALSNLSVSSIVDAYKNAYDDYTIPNAAYNEGVRQIENGVAGTENWEYSEISGLNIKNESDIEKFLRENNPVR